MDDQVKQEILDLMDEVTKDLYQCQCKWVGTKDRMEERVRNHQSGDTTTDYHCPGCGRNLGWHQPIGKVL